MEEGDVFQGNSLTWNEGKGITDRGLVFRVVSYPLLGAADRPPMSEAGKLKAGHNTTPKTIFLWNHMIRDGCQHVEVLTHEHTVVGADSLLML